MKFLADINITQTVISNLRKLKHDVLDIKRQDPQAEDTKIIELARAQDRIILTHDRDFEMLVSYPKHQVGVILFRLQVQNSHHFWEKLKDLTGHYQENELKKSLTIITEESIYIKPYSSKHLTPLF